MINKLKFMVFAVIYTIVQNRFFTTLVKVYNSSLGQPGRLEFNSSYEWKEFLRSEFTCTISSETQNHSKRFNESCYDE